MRKKLDQHDEIELISSSMSDKRSFKKSLGTLYEFYLSGAVLGPEEYTEWFDIIRSAGLRDIVKIMINSYGGDLSTALQFRRVLTETNAQVICSIEGSCMSAATIVFLCGDVLEVTPHSSFMIHNYSGGTIGKGGEMHAQITFERTWSEKLMRDVYQYFLNEGEITQVLDGRDLWFDTDEVVLRCEIAMEERKKAFEAQQALEDEDEVDAEDY